MEKALKVIQELQEKRLIKNYAIGGGIGAIFYIEALLTYDLGIFFIPVEDTKIMVLSDIYNYLQNKGYKPDQEQIIIEGIPVQLIPVYNNLIKEAVEEAVSTKYKDTETRLVKAEYLMAIMLETFRAKDKERLIRFLEDLDFNKDSFIQILKRYDLKGKYDHFMRLYYGE